MIRRLRGEVIERTPDHVVVDVQGVGYLVFVPARMPVSLGSEISLHIHTHVREDALSLYGFLDPMDLEIFSFLLGVPSIGPVKAMGILETPAEEIIASVQKGDAKQLAKLPGVGKKTAERMVVDLRDKFRGFVGLRPGAKTDERARPTFGAAHIQQDVESALINLGFKPNLAETAAKTSVEALGEAAGLEALVREALGHATRR